jgi:hypothetical protein
VEINGELVIRIMESQISDALELDDETLEKT